MSDERAKRILRIVREWQSRLERIAGREAEAYAELARRMEARIFRALEWARSEQVISELSKILRNGTGEMVRLADDSMLKILAQTLARDGAAISAAYGVESISQVRVARIVRTFDRFEDALQNKPGRMLSRLAPYRESFGARWSDHWTPVVRKVQAEFTRAQFTGAPTNAIARTLRNDLDTFNVSGHMDPEKFARKFVRGMFAELDSDASQALAEDAGLDQFINIGITDDRQSLTCFEASNAGAMTIEEWKEWRASTGSGGLPPRPPVPGAPDDWCRCSLQAVPTVMAGDDWSQPNEKFEEVAA